MKEINNRLEQHLLRFSVWMGVFFTFLGVIWGVAISSGAILFDGIYSGFSIILSLLSLLASRQVQQPRDKHFHFSRSTIEPLVTALKSIVIIGVCIYGIVGACINVIHGGAKVTSSLSGMLYSVIAVAACACSWLYLKNKGKNMPDLVQAESEQWLIDTVFSVCVFLSFLISFLLASTVYAKWVPYIDPGVVLLVSTYFIYTPLARFISSMREILQMAPDESVQKQIEEKLAEITKTGPYIEALWRSTKIGRELTVHIAFIVNEDTGKIDITELDNVRAEVENKLLTLGYRLAINIQFTKDRRWA